jgi:hypothetical protein
MDVSEAPRSESFGIEKTRYFEAFLAKIPIGHANHRPPIKSAVDEQTEARLAP